ncbi:MAG: tripartite tricarboxylate transporter substrate-binding protein [Clostridia bacterium]
MKKISSIMALVLTVVLMLTACQSSPAPVAEQPKGTPAAPAEKKAEPADDFPSKPITIYVDSKAGSSTDVISRGFAKVAEKHAGVPFIIENAEGGSGIIALNTMLGKPADGYAWFQQSLTLGLNIATGQAPIKVNDVVPIASLMEDYCVISVKADSPYKTFDDLVKAAKEKPGKLNWGAAKVKTSMHILTLKVAKAAGIDVNYIAYDSANNAKLGLLGNNVEATSSSIGIVREDVKAGKLRVLGMTLAERSPEFPDVPTFKELGYDYVTGYSVWRGLFVKPGIPQNRLDKMAEIIKKTVEDSEWQEFLKQQQLEDNYMDQPTFTKYFNDFVADSTDLVKDLK